MPFTVFSRIAKFIRVTSVADVQADHLFHGHYMQSTDLIEYQIGIVCQVLFQRYVEFLFI